MRNAGDDRDGVRLRGVIVVLWRAGLRISEALALSESDLDPARGEVMTAREVAELLRMPTSTVYELARKGVLPASRLGRTWRFLRPRLEQLLAA